MNSLTRRRRRAVRKNLHARSHYRLRLYGIAYEIICYTAKHQYEAELWRSLRDGLWERIGSWEIPGPPDRASVVTYLLPYLKTAG